MTPRANAGPRIAHDHPRTVRRVTRATGMISTAALDRMHRDLVWYRTLPPEQRSWIGLIVQTGIENFTAWLDDPDRGARLPIEVFSAAPPEMTRAVSLQQTVELVRLTVDVLEGRVEELAAAGEADWLRTALLRYSRELAFAAAQIYAQAAESRGAWDARLEAAVIDAILRGEPDGALQSRAAALGWARPGPVSVLVGSTTEHDPAVVAKAVHRIARHQDIDVLVGVQGARLVVVVGGTDDPRPAAAALSAAFGPGPVVVGPTVVDLAAATRSAEAALAGQRAAPAWPDAPRPVEADDLLAERAIAGDVLAKRQLIEEIYRPLVAAGPALLDTVSTFLEQAGSLEATARLLFVHPNTVRYRLRRVVEVTGALPTSSRSAFTLRIALTLGRLEPDDGSL
jgi:sugar diacid utilization regulator